MTFSRQDWLDNVSAERATEDVQPWQYEDEARVNARPDGKGPVTMTATEARRQQMRARIGPHKQVSDVGWVNVPAQPRYGVGAHRDPVVTTACGREVATTLATRRDDLVRCPNCLAAEVAR